MFFSLLSTVGSNNGYCSSRHVKAADITYVVESTMKLTSVPNASETRPPVPIDRNITQLHVSVSSVLATSRSSAVTSPGIRAEYAGAMNELTEACAAESTKRSHTVSSL